jgi:hypothetical protein
MTTPETTVATGTPQAPPKGWMVTLWICGGVSWKPDGYEFCTKPEEITHYSKIFAGWCERNEKRAWQITVAPLGGAEEWKG